MDTIHIRGARTHNLKNIDLDLPRDKLIVITGLSGSGKSSLAFDTIYAEGQRRYVESLSAYARQFLSVMEKPDVDHIEGLSPAISIEQKTTSHNPRSTVGTITEIYDYLRLLFSRAGTPRCPEHDQPLEAQTVSQMVDQVLSQDAGSRMMLLAPVISERKGEHHKLLTELNAQGFIRARIDGEIHELDQPPELELHKKHTIEAVVDRFRVREDLGLRLAESFETALALSGGLARVAWMDEPKRDELIFSANFACPLGVEQFFDPERVVAHPHLSLAAGAVRGWDRRNAYYFQLIRSLGEHYDFNMESPWEELPNKIRKIILYGSGRERITFSYFNERGGRHSKTHAFEGIIRNMERRYRETESSAVREELARYISTHPCPDCRGTRLNRAARHVFVAQHNLPSITSLPIGQARAFFESMILSGKRGKIAAKVVKEISQRLEFLVNVGLDYLTLDRSAETLSGGEAQRIRLASQIGAGLVGVMYVLDEPSIGLHQRDNERLLNTLTYLRDLGNTVIVVEHDEEAIRSADHVVDIGPGAGVHGGSIVAQGSADQIIKAKTSLTGKYLSGRMNIEVPTRIPADEKGPLLSILGASGNNLKSVNLHLPVGLFTPVAGQFTHFGF